MKASEKLAIDPDALDVEWLGQANLYAKYSELATEARAAMDIAKLELDMVTAQVAMEVRKRPDRFDLDKVTESSVDAAVKCDDRYLTANHVFIEARKAYDRAMGMMKSIDQRKSALENLVKLLGMEYFSGPAEPRNLGMEFGKRAQQVSARSKMKRQRRTRRRDQ